MVGPTAKTVRRRFFVALGHAMHVTWPVLSTILLVQVALGLLIGFIEGWSVGDALYFTFITGLTIGFGDVVPRQALARALAIGIGVSGLFLTGVIAAVAVHAMRAALDSDSSYNDWSNRAKRRIAAAGTLPRSSISKVPSSAG
jgi:Ion channel